MQIASNMNLHDLWTRMDANGALDFDANEAAEMRDQLVKNAPEYGWADTADIKDGDWFRMLSAVVA